jgi:hypothetical protein
MTTAQRNQIAQAIQHYLERHPNASDTVEGIRMWWLPIDWQVDINDVEAALIQMKEEGLVSLHRNSDNHVLFCLGNPLKQRRH